MKEIVIKPGVNGFRYSIYTSGGGFIFNAGSMKQIRDWYHLVDVTAMVC